MDKKDLQNHELDRIGRNLLGAVKVRDEEIERIIASPHLFESVKAGIKKEQTRRKPRTFPVWNWQLAGAIAVFTLALVGVAAILLKAPNAPEQAGKTIVPETNAIETRQEIPAQTEEVTKEQPTVRQIAFKAEKPKRSNKTEKQKPAKHPQTDESGGKFYSLALGGNWEADAENLRIVRAELSRAELFALGVNLPVENETQKIKTDLLVGANGVPKAIRFVE